MLFRQGLKKFNAERWDQAIDYFGRAQQLEGSPVITLLLARSYARRGQIVRATEYYRRTINWPLNSDARLAWKRATGDAKKELPEVEARTAMLTVRVELAPSPPTDERGREVSVQLDGETLPPALVDVEGPADPGDHRLLARAKGYLDATKTFSLAEGQHSAVVLKLALDPEWTKAPVVTPPESDVPPDQPPQKLDPVRPPDAGADYSTFAYFSLGVGFVGAVAGGYFLYQRREKDDEAAELFADCVAKGCAAAQRQAAAAEQARIDELDSDAATFGTYGVAGLIVGGAGLVAGVTFLLLDGGGGDRNTAGAHPWVGANQLGVSGRF